MVKSHFPFRRLREARQSQTVGSHLAWQAWDFFILPFTFYSYYILSRSK